MSFASFIEAVFDGFFQIMLTVLDLVVRCDMIVLPLVLSPGLDLLDAVLKQLNNFKTISFYFQTIFKTI